MKYRSPWKPWPAGVTMLLFIAPITLILLIGAILNRDWITGVFSFLFGAWCIWETADACIHVGMRIEAESRDRR